MHQINTLDISRLKAIRKQAIYNRSLAAEKRFKIAMEYLESLRKLKKMVKREFMTKVNQLDKDP